VAGVSLIERTLTCFAGIRQLQLVQEEPLVIQVNVVPAADWGAEVRRELVAELRAHLGADMRIEVQEVARIASEKNGKYRFSICRLE